MTAAAHARVFVVDDAPSMRDRVLELLDDIDGVDVVGEADSTIDAIAGIWRTRPDFVLLDFQLLGGTGLDVLRAIHPRAPEIVFVVLTNHAQPQYRRACLEAGARFFLDKSIEFGRITEVLGELGAPAHPHP
jgi:DNA-binding NarL/FixJ family response regulator